MAFGRISVIAADNTKREIHISKPTITIGRAPGCDVVLDDPLAADVHAQIANDARNSDFIALVDSAHRTVNGHRPVLGQPLRLRPASAIFIGKTALIFERTGAAPTQRAVGETPTLGIGTTQVAPVPTAPMPTTGRLAGDS